MSRSLTRRSASRRAVHWSTDAFQAAAFSRERSASRALGCFPPENDPHCSHSASSETSCLGGVRPNLSPSCSKRPPSLYQGSHCTPPVLPRAANLMHPVTSLRTSSACAHHLLSSPARVSEHRLQLSSPPVLPRVFSALSSQPARSVASRARAAPVKVSQQIGERARQRQQSRLWSLVIGGTAVAGFSIAALNTFQENLMFYITPTQAVEKFAQEPSKNRFRLGGLVLEGSVKTFSNSMEMEFVVTDLETDILVRYRGALPDLFREGHSIVAEGFLKPLPADLAEGDEERHGSEVPGPVEESASGLRSQNVSGGMPAGGAYAGGRLGLSEGEVVVLEGTGAGSGGDTDSGVEDVARKARGLGVMFTAMEVLAKHDEKYMPKEVAAVIAMNKAKQEEAEKAQELGEGRVPAFQSVGPTRPGKAEGEKAKLRKSVSHSPMESQAYEVTTN